jgi:ABC-type transporter Mla maintaining outer membrane lipid asymmetry ATPase subunit MlaF
MDATVDAPLLAIRALSLARGEVDVLDQVDFSLGRGQTVGLIGESGAGKSTIALAIIGLLRPPEVALRGSIRFDGVELTTLPEAQYRQLRGNRIGLIFQDATAALNPCFTVGTHLAEPLSRHLGLGARERRQRSIELLESVGIGEAGLRLDAFPHELSGGMQQRVMIAMALACDPQLLIADRAGRARAAGADPRQRARARATTGRMPVRTALRTCQRALHRGAAAGGPQDASRRKLARVGESGSGRAVRLVACFHPLGLQVATT